MLRIVGEGAFLFKISTVAVWEAIVMCWSSVPTRLLNYIMLY